MSLNQTSNTYSFLLRILSFFAFVFASYVAFNYASQLLLDWHSFRQTQTALTAYWLRQNGFSFAYETPVAGYPWSIPFEFPIYQSIVAFFWRITDFSLDSVGRIVSFAFLALCLFPIKSITRKMDIPQSVFYVFIILLFSSPLYLYWGRTFMIETAALFFSIVAIKYFVDMFKEDNPYRDGIIFSFFMTLALLQKSTTALPIFVILGGIYVLLRKKADDPWSLGKRVIFFFVIFGIPLAIGGSWAVYSDYVKEFNSLRKYLTSSALSQWNWGSFSQRVSLDLYKKVIWERIFSQNLAGLFGVALLLITAFSKISTHIKNVFFICLLMGFLPLFLFTNLHIVHNYYQSANVIFLLYAAAISLGYTSNIFFEKGVISFLCIALFAGSNYYYFFQDCFKAIQEKYNVVNSRDFAVSQLLKKEVPKEKYFVAFGNDWSSTFSYFAERKSFTVPHWFKQYNEIAHNPENFIDENHLGAVVACMPVTFPTLDYLMEWSSNKRNWKIQNTHNCYIATPEIIPFDKNIEISERVCQGNIDEIKQEMVGGHKTMSVFGWATLLGDKNIVPEKTYLTLEKEDSPLYFETQRVYRSDVNDYLGNSNLGDVGFSRFIDASSLQGNYKIGVITVNNGRPEKCQMQKSVSINE